MELKKLNKINEKLANYYTVTPVLKDDWVLYRRDASKRMILNSGKNSEKELDKFVKEHSTYNFVNAIEIETLILNAICLLLCVINFLFIHSTFISGIVLGMLVVALPILITIMIVFENNYKVWIKVKNEDIDAVTEQIKKAINECVGTIEKKTTKKSSTKTPRKKANKKGEEKKD